MFAAKGGRRRAGRPSAHGMSNILLVTLAAALSLAIAIKSATTEDAPNPAPQAVVARVAAAG